MTRRLTELALLGPRLDANYVAITESPHQGKLFARDDATATSG